MKKEVHSLFAMAIIVLAVAVVSSSAQSARLAVVNIPFNFVVKDRALPAGEYTIEPLQIGASQALRIQSRDGHITEMVLAWFARTISNQVEPALVFNRFGNEYFLSQVLGVEKKATYVLPKSRTEDALAKSGSASKRDPVSITGHHQ